ncbi:MCE family protein [Mycolicibacterium sp. XJ879]
MTTYRQKRAITRRWWAAILVSVMAVYIAACWLAFERVFTSYIQVTLASERSGLMMEPGGRVKLRGVDVGRVDKIISTGDKPVRLQLEILKSQLDYIPANVAAQITANTAFGSKHIDLIIPEQPSAARLAAGAVLRSQNVSTEVNTVFDNLVSLIQRIDPEKLNGVLSALAEGLRGRGQQINDAVAGANSVVAALNARADVINVNWRELADFSSTYASAAQEILEILDAAANTGSTITDRASALDSMLLSAIGFANSGTAMLAPNGDGIVDLVNLLRPTTDLLMKYQPSFTCLLVGAKWWLDNGGYAGAGGNGRTLLVDAAVLLGNDPYVYPNNLPIVAAKGGPGGRPGCGSLPHAYENFPVRAMVTNTGWSAGIDIRPNPGLGHPCYANYLPVTRAVPEPPSVRCQGPPSPGLPVAVPPPPPPPPSPASAEAPDIAGPPPATPHNSAPSP